MTNEEIEQVTRAEMQRSMAANRKVRRSGVRFKALNNCIEYATANRNRKWEMKTRVSHYIRGYCNQSYDHAMNKQLGVNNIRHLYIVTRSHITRSGDVEVEEWICWRDELTVAENKARVFTRHKRTNKFVAHRTEENRGDIKYIASITGQTEEEIIRELGIA